MVSGKGLALKVFFRNPTICNMLQPKLKAEVIATVSRQSAISRLTDFFNKAELLIRMMEYQAQMPGPRLGGEGHGEAYLIE
jgi:hypothetical protein